MESDGPVNLSYWQEMQLPGEYVQYFKISIYAPPPPWIYGMYSRIWIIVVAFLSPGLVIVSLWYKGMVAGWPASVLIPLWAGPSRWWVVTWSNPRRPPLPLVLGQGQAKDAQRRLNQDHQHNISRPTPTTIIIPSLSITIIIHSLYISPSSSNPCIYHHHQRSSSRSSPFSSLFSEQTQTTQRISSMRKLRPDNDGIDWSVGNLSR